MSELVKIKNGRGSDEANLDGVSHKIHADGYFYLPPDVAARLVGVGGFYRADPSERPEAGTASLEEVTDLVFALDPGPVRAALIQVLSAHGAL
jgi:hypothetical protein